MLMAFSLSFSCLLERLVYSNLFSLHSRLVSWEFSHYANYTPLLHKFPTVHGYVPSIMFRCYTYIKEHHSYVMAEPCTKRIPWQCLVQHVVKLVQIITSHSLSHMKKNFCKPISHCLKTNEEQIKALVILMVRIKLFPYLMLMRYWSIDE